jgi:hypothetical protein
VSEFLMFVPLAFGHIVGPLALALVWTLERRP